MATLQIPNAITEDQPQMEQEKEQRNWAELNGDILMEIFRMIGILDVFKGAGSVCRAWRRVAKDEPDLWRRIDMTNHNYAFESDVLRDLTKLAIDRSKGRLEEFWIEDLGNDDLLQYLSDRTTVLKSLKLILCFQIREEGLINTVKKQPLLEELQITFGSFSGKLPELVGKEIPNLKRFKLNRAWSFPPSPNPYDDDEEMVNIEDEEAFGIGKTMHELRDLQLIGNRLTNEGLKAILQGCPHLETLDLRRCYNIDMDSDMRARCGRLDTFRSPDDSLDDYEFKAETSPDRSDMDYDEYGDDDFGNVPFNYVDDDFGANFDDFPWDIYDPTDSDDDWGGGNGGGGGGNTAALEEYLGSL
ncbi:hypothetical protein LUZ60_009073 [Juncus effusus]|nr:hypothetical protein LUZ60_009073 [Juncus effusus]